MFDTGQLPDSPGVSVAERSLRRLVRRHAAGLLTPQPFPVDAVDVPARAASWRRPATVLLADGFRPHGRGADNSTDDGERPLTPLARLLEAGAEQLAAAKAAERAMARAAAERARALAAFCALRQAAALDLPPEHPGAASPETRARRPEQLTAVSEWALDEVAPALALTAGAAEALLVDSITLAEQLPATAGMLEQGLIGWEHARVLAELLREVADDKRAQAEAAILALAPGKDRSRLRQTARRIIARIDAAAATRRLAQAIRDRGVRLHPGEDGVDTLTANLASPVARAAYTALERYAEACKTPGDTRTKDQRMADCLAELILRPGTLPSVEVELTLIAGVDTMLGGDAPGELDGRPLPAALVRELAYTLGLLPRPSTPQPDDETERAAETGPAEETATAEETAAAEQTEPAGEIAAAEQTEPAGEIAAAEQTEERPEESQRGADAAPADRQARLRELADLLELDRVAGTALTHRPHIAVVDQLTGSLLALTDTQTLRTGGPVGPPPDSPGYTPRAELERFVRLRDRRCRFPGCRARAKHCDLDHRVPWPLGPTSHTNLCCLCEHHHRLKTHAPGWTTRPLPDGGLEWTTPSGDTFTTHPPRFGGDDEPVPVRSASPANGPPPPEPPPPIEDDPPPF